MPAMIIDIPLPLVATVIFVVGAIAIYLGTRQRK
jgi:hypothetical protein